MPPAFVAEGSVGFKGLPRDGLFTSGFSSEVGLLHAETLPEGVLVLVDEGVTKPWATCVDDSM